jgi:hypothetical protein
MVDGKSASGLAHSGKPSRWFGRRPMMHSEEMAGGQRLKMPLLTELKNVVRIGRYKDCAANEP